MKTMRKMFTIFTMTVFTAISLSSVSNAQAQQPANQAKPKKVKPTFLPVTQKSRIKDIVTFQNIHENHLVGYGLVVGLHGSGDTFRNVPFAELSLASMLERQGINIKDQEMKPKNVAAVMVTAKLPAFAREGSLIDVNVSSMGDASDLKGGTLLVTGLLGADGETYAAAQGVLAVGGFTVKGDDGGSVTQGVPTNGRIPNGARIIAENDFQLSEMSSIKMALTNPDLTTARRIEAAINKKLGMRLAKATDPNTVLMVRPVGYHLQMVDMLAAIENEMVTPDQKAIVVIDERTGTIVMGQDIRVSMTTVAQANLVIKVEEDPQQGAGGNAGNANGAGAVAQPGAPGPVVANSKIGIDDGKDKRFHKLGNFVTLDNLIHQLHALELGPRDIITIVQALKTAGALQAEIKTM